jgi:hypothetical protein
MSLDLFKMEFEVTSDQSVIKWMEEWERMINANEKAYIVGDDYYKTILSQLHVDVRRNDRWFICYPDGNLFDDKPYKTSAAAKAGLTRLKNTYRK